MTQQMRISQFVITYGPGSILEGTCGPRIIPLPDIGLFSPNNLNPEKFEISDIRMSNGLLNGDRIFRLPSNAEMNVPQTVPLYHTSPFPEWKLCHNTQHHSYKNHKGFSVLFAGQKCPMCKSTRREHMEPVRFVIACPDGHLDDADWLHMIPHEEKCKCNEEKCSLLWLKWTGTGGRLADIKVECPFCGKWVNLGQAYKQLWPCKGRFPEREEPDSQPQRPGCRSGARLIQRQASNLRIPELRTLFTIPPRHTCLHNLLQLRPIYFNIVGKPPSSRAELRTILNNLQQQNFIPSGITQEILEHTWDEIERAIQDVLLPVPRNYSDLLLEEMHAFIDASLKSIFPEPGSAPVLIEVDSNRVRRTGGPCGRNFRIVPVLRLRTVTVQKGYRREVDTSKPAQVVDISIPDPNMPRKKWYPGVEFFGEGIFVMLDDNDGWHFQLGEEDDVNKWLSVWRNNSVSPYPDFVFRDKSSRHELHPVFVWWHTLSHLLIRAISVEAGYPSASIRERVYFEIDGNRVRGGLLLYAVQPGSAGTLGGLIGLVPYFSSIFQRAFDLLENCPGDPVCYENTFQAGKYCGASCYGCLFLSETSCEHRNMWLDRRILKKNLP